MCQPTPHHSQSQSVSFQQLPLPVRPAWAVCDLGAQKCSFWEAQNSSNWKQQSVRACQQLPTNSCGQLVDVSCSAHPACSSHPIRQLHSTLQTGTAQLQHCKAGSGEPCRQPGCRMCAHSAPAALLLGLGLTALLSAGTCPSKAS